MKIFKNRYQANKARKEKMLSSYLTYKVIKHKEGYIVACGLLTL